MPWPLSQGAQSPKAGPIRPYTENVLDLRKSPWISTPIHEHMYIFVFEKKLMHDYDVQFNLFTSTEYMIPSN